MRKKLILISILACSAPVLAQVHIDINLNLYPELVPVPGYPVYYAPQMNSNYFFYDGLYWVYQDEDWYSSSWYNGPWRTVDRFVVPVFILRIPVRYYRRAPTYFQGWYEDDAPRWDQHWGNEWQSRRQGWDRWDHHTPSTRPPLPLYQRNYTGDRYPQLPQQQALQNKNYHYQPRDPMARQQWQEQSKNVLPMPAQIAPISPMPGQGKSRANSREPNDANERDTGRRDGQGDRRDYQRGTAPVPLPHNVPGRPERVEPQRVTPPAQPQNPQMERDYRQEQRQEQRSERPTNNRAPTQEQNRAQRPEQQHERSNEKSKDRNNDRDDERGQDRRK